MATKPEIQFTNPADIHAPFGYTHVVTATGGQTIYISGQVPLDGAGNLIGEGDFAAQARQIFENLKKALAPNVPVGRSW